MKTDEEALEYAIDVIIFSIPENSQLLIEATKWLSCHPILGPIFLKHERAELDAATKILGRRPTERDFKNLRDWYLKAHEEANDVANVEELIEPITGIPYDNPFDFANDLLELGEISLTNTKKY